jgi:tripartite-type tricarboxylate transporter receptor subunit TctC
MCQYGQHHEDRRQSLRLGGVVAAPRSSIVSAQPYPARPIIFTVGGLSDVIARTPGRRRRGALGQPVLNENVVGAGGSVSLGRVAPAAPGGYMVVLVK